MSQKYLRGNIYYANLSPVTGSEQGGFRPVVILQNDIGNQHSSTVIIAPITRYIHKKKKLPTHVCVDSILPCKSVVLLEQIQTLDKSRLSDYIGRLDDMAIYRINQRLCISLGLTEVV